MSSVCQSKEQLRLNSDGCHYVVVHDLSQDFNMRTMTGTTNGAGTAFPLVPCYAAITILIQEKIIDCREHKIIYSKKRDRKIEPQSGHWYIIWEHTSILLWYILIYYCCMY